MAEKFDISLFGDTPLSPHVLFANLNISDYMNFDIFYHILINNCISDEEENIDERIKEEGFLNVLKVNVKVTNRRRINPSVPMVQKSSLFIFSANNRSENLKLLNIFYRQLG